MPVQTLNWILNDEVPICHLSVELADRLIATGAYDTTTCPNYVLQTVGMKPGGCNIVIQNKYRDKLKDDWTNKILIDIFSDGKKIDEIRYERLFVTTVYELAKHKNNLTDDDLLVVELRDVRSQWDKLPFLTFTEEDEFDDVVEHIGENYIPIVSNFSISYLHFKPESETAHKQSMPMSGKADKLFEEALNRVESYCYVTPFGDLNTERFPTFAPLADIEKYFDCAVLTRSLGEYEIKKVTNEAESISVNFYESPGTLKFNEFLLPYDVRGKAVDGTVVSVFPLTAPVDSSLSENDSYSEIANLFKEQVQFSDTCEEYVIILPFIISDINVVSRFDDRTVLVLGDYTTYSVTSNPYGLMTQFIRKRRHGIERYCLKTDSDETQDGLIVVQGYCLSAVTTATEEFKISVTGQNEGDEFIGEEVNVINPLNNQNSTERGYELKVSDYVTALSWEGEDENGNTNFLCIDGPCFEGEYETENPPTDIILSNDTVDENSPGTAIGSLTVVDEDLPDDSHTLEIIGDDKGLEIVNDILKVKNDSGVNSDDSPLSIDILATDDGGRKYQETFLITVNGTPTSGRFALDSVAIAVSTGTQKTGTQTAASYDNDENSIPNNFTWRVTSAQKMASGDTVTYVVKNYGTGSLTLSDVSVEGDLFASVDKSSSTITSGSSDTFIVSCLTGIAPIFDIPYLGRITFTHDGDEFGMVSPYVYSLTHYGFQELLLGGANNFSANQNGGGGTSTSSIDGNSLEGSVIEYTESTGEAAGYASLSSLTDGDTYDVYVRYRVSSSGTQGYKFTNSTTYAAGGWTAFSDMPTAYTGLGDSYGGDEFEKILTNYIHNSTSDPYMWVTSGTNAGQTVYLDRIVFLRIALL